MLGWVLRGVLSLALATGASVAAANLWGGNVSSGGSETAPARASARAESSASAKVQLGPRAYLNEGEDVLVTFTPAAILPVTAAGANVAGSVELKSAVTGSAALDVKSHTEIQIIDFEKPREVTGGDGAAWMDLSPSAGAG